MATSLDNVHIDPDFKTLWSTALSSGDYQQCNGALSDGIGYCCLGVAATIKGARYAEGEHEPEWSLPLQNDIVINDGDLLNDRWASTELGLTQKHQDVLSALNDGRMFDVHTTSPIHDAVVAFATATGLRFQTNHTSVAVVTARDEGALLPNMTRFYPQRPLTFNEISHLIVTYF